jgi:hypothetical protein
LLAFNPHRKKYLAAQHSRNGKGFLPSELDPRLHYAIVRHVTQQRPERFGQEYDRCADFMPEILPEPTAGSCNFQGKKTAKPQTQNNG